MERREFLRKHPTTARPRAEGIEYFPNHSMLSGRNRNSIARVANGKITESRNNWDALGLMQQLDVVSEATGRAA